MHRTKGSKLDFFPPTVEILWVLLALTRVASPTGVNEERDESSASPENCLTQPMLGTAKWGFFFLASTSSSFS